MEFMHYLAIINFVGLLMILYHHLKFKSTLRYLIGVMVNHEIIVSTYRNDIDTALILNKILTSRISNLEIKNEN